MTGHIKNPLGLGLAVVATCFLFLSGLAIPLAGVLLIPLVPQPALAHGLRYGKGPAMGVLFATGGFLLLIGGLETAMGFAFIALMVAMLFFSFGRGWSIEGIVIGTAIGMIAAISTVLLFLAGSFSQLREATANSLKESLELSLMIYQKAGLSAETIQIARESSPEVIDMIIRILPAVAFIAFVAIVLINLVLLRYRFPELRNDLFSVGDPKEWTSPDPVIWCFIFAGFALFLPDGFLSMGFELRTLAMNILMIVALFYFFQGLAVVAYFFHHKHVPLFLRGLGYGVIALEQLATLGVVGLGLFDLWGDFRRLKKTDLNETEAI